MKNISTIVADTLLIAVDKISKTIFTIEDNDDLYSGGSNLTMHRKGSKLQINTLVSLKTPDNIKLGIFDKIVYDAVNSLYAFGNQYVSCNMIYHTLRGNNEKQCSITNRKVILESLEKLMSAEIEIDASEEAVIYPSLADFKYHGKLLPTTFTKQILNGSLTDCFYISEEPVLLQYAKAKKHIVRVDFSLIDSVPGRIFAMKIKILYYVLYRLLCIRHVSSSINYQPLYSLVGVKTNDKKELLDVRKYTREILEAWKGQIFRDIVLTGYQEIKRGKIVYQIVLSYDLAGRKSNSQVSEASCTKKEHEIYNFLLEFVDKADIKMHDRSLYKANGEKVELDILLEPYDFAIELDGVVFHNTSLKDQTYHQQKTNLCEETGIFLMHILDKEWEYQTDLVKAYLKARIGRYDEEIHALNCKIAEVQILEYQKFIKNNCLGKIYPAEKALGLYYENTLIAVLGYTGNTLANYCNKAGIRIIDGLFTLASTVNAYKPLLMHADRRFANTKEYLGQGFTCIAHMLPKIIYSKDKYIGYIPEQNQKEDSYFKVWDSGELLLQFNY